MTHNRTIWVVCCLLMLSVLRGKAQPVIWSSLSFEKKIIRKTNCQATIGYRFSDPFDDYSLFGQIRITRKFQKKVRLKLAYRYTRKENLMGTLRLKHRPSIALSKQWKIQKYKLNFRSKFQIDIQNQINLKRTDLVNLTWRNKFLVEKKIRKKLHYYGGGEIFMFGKSFSPSEYRVSSGIAYALKKRLKYKIAYVFSTEFKSKTNLYRHIVSSSLSYRF
jgi:hypothetical protein